MMSGPEVGQRYLPLSTDRVVGLLTQDRDSTSDREDLAGLARLLRSLLHARYRERWEQAQAAYAPFGPDADGPASDEQAAIMLAELAPILDSANYDEVPRAVLERALGESAVFKVALHARLEDFADLRLWRRSAAPRHDTVTRWFGLKKQEVDYLQYDRVVLWARYQDQVPGDDLPYAPGTALLKLYQDVPEADLEMLLPNTEVRMRTFDKVVIGVPAAISGVIVAVTKLATALGVLFLLAATTVGIRAQEPEIDRATLVTLLAGLAAFLGYLWRQWSKYKNRRIAFMQTLSQNLYGKTLGDGPGVLFTVLEAAEQEDVKEALLAYRGLLDGPLTADDLDDRVEGWLRPLCPLGSLPVDFDVADGLRTLVSLGVVVQHGSLWQVREPADATRALRDRWQTLGDGLLSGEGSRRTAMTASPDGPERDRAS